jgi:ATP-dependent 26S proteasome regulatory subunit
MKTLAESSGDHQALAFRTAISSSLPLFPSVQNLSVTGYEQAPTDHQKNVDSAPQSLSKFQKKTRKFTFQHSGHSLCLSVSVVNAPTSHIFPSKTPAIPAFPPNPTWLFSVPLLILHFEFSTLNFFTSHQNVDSFGVFALSSAKSKISNLKFRTEREPSRTSGPEAASAVAKIGLSLQKNNSTFCPLRALALSRPVGLRIHWDASVVKGELFSSTFQNVDSGISHLFSSKSPAIPAFSPNSTWLSLQKNNFPSAFCRLVEPLLPSRKNVDSAPQALPKFQKKPAFAPIRGLFRRPSLSLSLSSVSSPVLRSLGEGGAEEDASVVKSLSSLQNADFPLFSYPCPSEHSVFTLRPPNNFWPEQPFAIIALVLEQEIETLIRARYPLLYIVSAEEARVDKILAKVAEHRKKDLFEWSSSIGIAPQGSSIQMQRSKNAPTRDPLLALDQVIEQVEPAIFVFKDFHPYLARGNHATIRKLKEITLHLKNSFKTIIIVSPVLEIPPEIEKEITVLHLPLPDRAELSALLDRIAEELRRFKQIKIDLDEPGRERLLQAALGLTLSEAENVFARVIVQKERLSGLDVREVLTEKQQIVRKSGLLEYYEAEENFETVGGLGLLKEWLVKRSSAFTQEAREFGLAAPKGILLLGVQGCGKSLSAKAVSNLWQLPLLRFDMGRVFGSYVGSSEENIRRAIAVAESVAPAILWVDEIDKAFAGTQGSGMSDAGTSARVFGTFLTWLSEKRSSVFVVATANNISNLPPELLRKGRLDEIFFIDLPLLAERAEIFSIHLARRHRDPAAFDLPTLAKATDQFSGAEIEEVINSALYDAFSSGEQLTTEHLMHVIAASVPIARTMKEQVENLRAWAKGRARLASVG